MQSATVRAFFSCSFKKDDKPVNDFFRALCEGLDIACHNVDGGYTEVPPDKARQLIAESDAVIAIAPARNRFHDSDEYAMPEAVSNEISIAYGLKRPILIIKEDNVRTDGFLTTYATYLSFSRTQLHDPEFIKKAVKSIHMIKMGSLSEHELLVNQEHTEYVAESASHLYELEREGQGFVWQHSLERKIVFTKNFFKPLKIWRWNDVASGRSPDGLPPVEVRFEIISSSRHFDTKISFDELGPFGVIGNIAFDPMPVVGDFIEFFLSFRGAALIPIFADDVFGGGTVEIDGIKYNAFEGIIPVNKAKAVDLQFRIPREYGVHVGDIHFFSGSFTQGVDYVVQSEIDRARVTKEVVGGKISISAKLTSPLLRHIYGIAWNPPNRPASVPLPPN